MLTRGALTSTRSAQDWYFWGQLTPEEETRHTVEALTSSVTACLDIFVQN